MAPYARIGAEPHESIAGRQGPGVIPSPDDRATIAESDTHLISTQSTRQPEAERKVLDWTRVATHISAIMVAVVVLDQMTKMLVVAWIGPDQPSHRWEIAGPWLAFEYIENTGAAFGMLAGRVWLLSILAIVVAAGFVLVFRSSLPHSAWLRLSLGLVIGGGIGNFLDRLRLGYVIDFLAIGIWPKFNLADSAITIGLVVLALIALREETSREHIT